MPDIDHGSSDWFLRYKIQHPPPHQRHLALMGAHYDTVAIVAEGGIGAPEGAEDGRGGGDFVSLDRKLVFNLVDEPAKRLASSLRAIRGERTGLRSRFESDDV